MELILSFKFIHFISLSLSSVHKSYDRALSDPSGLTFAQCHGVLKTLGFRKDLIGMDNLRRLLSLVREILSSSHEASPPPRESNMEHAGISFEEFCLINSYLSVLQQEIQENCISPIKGTDLPPPRIFLTNSPGKQVNNAHLNSANSASYTKTLFFQSSTGMINQYSKQCSQNDEPIIGICSQQQQSPLPPTSSHQQQNHAFNRNFTIDASSSTSSIASNDDRHMMMSSSNGPRSDSSRDSGTSSPLPNEIVGRLTNGNSGSSIHSKSSLSGTPEIKMNDYDSDSNDSNDSVFSTGSSLDDEQNFKDIYLGGSCALRTKWRNLIAIPLLNKKGISYHLPSLDENLTMKKTHKDGKTLIQEIADGSDENSLFKPRILDSSRVLLFVITKETRSLAPMTLAAHYIGLSYNVVLCIQTLEENCKIGNDQVSLTVCWNHINFQV